MPNDKQEIRDVHMSLQRLIKSSYHMSSDFIFDALNDKTAEVRCKILGCYSSFDSEGGDSFAVGTVNFSALRTEDGWRIQKMTRKIQKSYQEVSIS